MFFIAEILTTKYVYRFIILHYEVVKLFRKLTKHINKLCSTVEKVKLL